MQDVPYGYCHCGCGERTKIATASVSRQGVVKGEPFRFIHGHNQRIATRSVAERFWEKVDKDGPGGCWVWRGAPQPSGYGRFFVDKDTKPLAHRFCYELVVGPVPDGLALDHLCRNRRCVNPAHLEVVTPAENNLRGFGWSGRNARKTHCPQGHPYAGDNLILGPHGERRCRICTKELNRRRRFKGNAPASRTHCPQGHPLNGDNLYVNPKGARCCRTCRREQDRVRHRNK